MTPWDKKLQQFEIQLEQRLAEHKSTVDVVRGNLPKLAEDAAAVQARMLLEFALCNPELARVPTSTKDNEFTTVFDMISKNVLSSLVTFGTDYLNDCDTD